MHTSNFWHPGIKTDPQAVSIARFTPRWWGKGRRYIALAPSADLMRRIKEGLPWPAYGREYNQQLAALDPARIWQDLQDSTLICYERPGDNCHRRLVAAWLERELSVSVPEL